MRKMFDLNSYPLKDNLDKLLVDKTTGKNIIFATDDYLQYDKGAGKEVEVTVDFLNKYGDGAIRPRFCKSSQHQSDRTKENAEVFTPAWICNKMIDYCEDELDCEWKDYINATFLEITCGEAPFLCSRYDSSSGEFIEVKNRTGIIDRKLNAISNNCNEPKQCFDHTLDAYKSIYGYEFQGDSLLIARINMLMSFIEHMEYKFGTKPSDEQLDEIIDVICWNVFQMDGLKNVIPFKEVKQGNIQTTLFDLDSESNEESANSLIYDWKKDNSIEFFKLKEGNVMKFDFCIGNPPYQDTTIGDNETFAPPVYDKFINESSKISDKTMLIHPARFLFNAGSTSKKWNKSMLTNSHYKILEYYPKSSTCFQNTDIKGGVAISYMDKTKNFGPIEVFTPFEELNSIFKKVCSLDSFHSFSNIIESAYAYHFTEKLYEDYPEFKSRLSKGHEYDLKSNVFELIPEIFTENETDKNNIQILGRRDGNRVFLWTSGCYINRPINFDKYKVFIAGANGSGAIGETLSTPLIGTPLIGNTESFISIGSFDSLIDAENCMAYIKTKFARVLLGILKVTQAITPGKWKYVPMQDFSVDSDIDWSKSIPEIDKQLYKKYKLSKDEIDFIETHVKEMK